MWKYPNYRVSSYKVLVVNYNKGFREYQSVSKVEYARLQIIAYYFPKGVLKCL